MKQIVLTQQEIWMATRHLIQRSKKVYSRKNKHRNFINFEKNMF
jgi:hypothetical protein